MYIAVIEEADSIQDMLRSVLEFSGHHIETYRTMPDALPHYDLIIVEPGEESQELVRLLPLHSSRMLSVLVLTFHEANLALARRHLLPVLWKMPFRLSVLLAMIEQLGSQSTHHQQHTLGSLLPKRVFVPLSSCSCEQE